MKQTRGVGVRRVSDDRETKGQADNELGADPFDRRAFSAGRRRWQSATTTTARSPAATQGLQAANARCGIEFLRCQLAHQIHGLWLRHNNWIMPAFIHLLRFRPSAAGLSSAARLDQKSFWRVGRWDHFLL